MFLLYRPLLFSSSIENMVAYPYVDITKMGFAVGENILSFIASTGSKAEGTFLTKRIPNSLRSNSGILVFRQVFLNHS
jgi:hypothetical protein